MVFPLEYFELFVFGFIYFILAVQVLIGFPPFYRSFSTPSQSELEVIVPFVFTLMLIVAVTAITGWGALFGLFGVVALIAGYRIRAVLIDCSNGPVVWLSLWVSPKWPMLVFDVWTIGISAVILLIIL